MTNYIVSVACATFIAVSALQSESSRPSPDQLLNSLKQSLLLASEGAVSSLELSTDISVVESSLLPLLTFAHQNSSLQNKLIDCLKTLIINTKSALSPLEIKIKNTEAVVACQEEFIFFCNSSDQYDTINTCLYKIKLYYEPLSTVFATAKQQEYESNKPIKIIGICAASAAVVTLAYYIIVKPR